MIPIDGRNRAIERTVNPVSDTHTMAAASSSVAARQAAPLIASVIELSGEVAVLRRRSRIPRGQAW